MQLLFKIRGIHLLAAVVVQLGDRIANVLLHSDWIDSSIKKLLIKAASRTKGGKFLFNFVRHLFIKLALGEFGAHVIFVQNRGLKNADAGCHEHQQAKKKRQ